MCPSACTTLQGGFSVCPDLLGSLLERIDVEHPAKDLGVEFPANCITCFFGRNGSLESKAGPIG